MEMKQYLNVMKSDVGVADAWKKLLAFYNCLPLTEDFKDVDKSDFKKLAMCSYRQQKGKKLPDISELARFTSSEPPPLKTALSNTSIL